jgi:hypothetical protein
MDAIRRLVGEEAHSTGSWYASSPLASSGGPGTGQGIVGESRERPYCSFCGRTQGNTLRVVAGPGADICQECVWTARSVLATGTRATTPTATIGKLAPGADEERCSFCAKPDHQVAGLVAAGEARICDECLALCQEIFTEEPT